MTQRRYFFPAVFQSTKSNIEDAIRFYTESGNNPGKPRITLNNLRFAVNISINRSEFFDPDTKLIKIIKILPWNEKTWQKKVNYLHMQLFSVYHGVEGYHWNGKYPGFCIIESSYKRGSWLETTKGLIKIWPEFDIPEVTATGIDNQWVYNHIQNKECVLNDIMLKIIN